MTARTQPATTPAETSLDHRRREEIVRRYWLNGDLTPLAVANRLAGQKALAPA